MLVQPGFPCWQGIASNFPFLSLFHYFVQHFFVQRGENKLFSFNFQGKSCPLGGGRNCFSLALWKIDAVRKEVIPIMVNPTIPDL